MIKNKYNPAEKTHAAVIEIRNTETGIFIKNNSDKIILNANPTGKAMTSLRVETPIWLKIVT